MKLLAPLLAFLLLVDDDVYTVTLAFESMHCDECKSALETNLKAGVKDVQKVAIEGETATVVVKDGGAPDLSKLRRAVPGDLKLKAVGVKARGTVATKGSDLVFTWKDTTQQVPLSNRDEKPKQDRLSELRKEMGGKNRFEIAGELREKERIPRLVVDSFAKTDWEKK
jgi:copper chaperone CopZ